MFLYAYGTSSPIFVRASSILLSAIGDDYVYCFFLSFLEGAIALLIVWFAWRWPEAAESR
jgi:hypothetical protein